MTDFQDIVDQLSYPFRADQIHWRCGPLTKDKSATIPLAYIDARDVMERLDEVVGAGNWQDEYTEGPSGRVFCHISVRNVHLREHVEWIKKGDGAGATDVEGAKGAISDAFKRAAVKFGIGRYLYGIKADWVKTVQKYGRPSLPDDFDGRAFLPEPAFSSKQMKTKYWNGLIEAASEDDALKAKELVDELDNMQKMELWRDLSSGVKSKIKALLND